MLFSIFFILLLFGFVFIQFFFSHFQLLYYFIERDHIDMIYDRFKSSAIKTNKQINKKTNLE